MPYEHLDFAQTDKARTIALFAHPLVNGRRGGVSKPGRRRRRTPDRRVQASSQAQRRSCWRWRSAWLNRPLSAWVLPKDAPWTRFLPRSTRENNTEQASCDRQSVVAARAIGRWPLYGRNIGLRRRSQTRPSNSRPWIPRAPFPA